MLQDFFVPFLGPKWVIFGHRPTPIHGSETNNLCSGYIDTSWFFKAYLVGSSWVIGKSTFDRNPVVKLNLDFNQLFVSLHLTEKLGSQYEIYSYFRLDWITCTFPPSYADSKKKEMIIEGAKVKILHYKCNVM